MGFIEGRTRFGEGTRPTLYFAILAAVLTLPAVLLLAFPARVLAAADISISKQGPSRVEPGHNFKYVLTVANQGADKATGIVVTDDLPNGVTFVKYEASAGVTCNPPVGGTVTCNPFDLAAGKTKTITLTVMAPSDPHKIKNLAKADPDNGSPVTSDSVTTTVAPRLVIDKLDDPDPVRTEAILAYTLRVQNQGSADANDLTVTDELPLDVLDFVSIDSRDFKCEYKAGLVKCEKALLQPGDIAKVEIAVEPERARTIQNTGEVFVKGVSQALDSDTEKTVVIGRGDDGPDRPDGPDGPDGPNSGDTNDTNDTNDAGDGGNNLVPNTKSTNSLPNTGGASLLELAVVALGLAVVGGATVVGTGSRRRDG